MTVKIDEVAARAGVSVSTVSRVISGRAAVAEATRARVQAAIEELGYHRSTLLASSTARLVALGIPTAPEHWQMDVCQSVAVSLQSAGLLVATPFLDAGASDLHAAVEAGAALVVTPTFSPLDVDVPVVRFAEAVAGSAQTLTAGAGTGPAGPTPSDASAPGSGVRGPAVLGSELLAAHVDLADGMTKAFDHLVALGHRRIGLVCNDSGVLAAQLTERFLAEHPVKRTPERLREWIAAVPKTEAGGAEASVRLRDATCTALIVQSALPLHGVFAALRRRRLRVPRDMSVVGFGDSLTMRNTAPPTTVLDLDTEALARALVAGVRGVLGLPGETTGSVPSILGPRLVARSSTTAVGH